MAAFTFQPDWFSVASASRNIPWRWSAGSGKERKRTTTFYKMIHSMSSWHVFNIPLCHRSQSHKTSQRMAESESKCDRRWTADLIDGHAAMISAQVLFPLVSAILFWFLSFVFLSQLPCLAIATVRRLGVRDLLDKETRKVRESKRQTNKKKKNGAEQRKRQLPVCKWAFSDSESTVEEYGCNTICTCALRMSFNFCFQIEMNTVNTIRIEVEFAKNGAAAWNEKHILVAAEP